MSHWSHVPTLCCACKCDNCAYCRGILGSDLELYKAMISGDPVSTDSYCLYLELAPFLEFSQNLKGGLCVDTLSTATSLPSVTSRASLSVSLLLNAVDPIFKSYFYAMRVDSAFPEVVVTDPYASFLLRWHFTSCASKYRYKVPSFGSITRGPGKKTCNCLRA